MIACPMAAAVGTRRVEAATVLQLGPLWGELVAVDPPLLSVCSICKIDPPLRLLDRLDRYQVIQATATKAMDPPLPPNPPCCDLRPKHHHAVQLPRTFRHIHRWYRLFLLKKDSTAAATKVRAELHRRIFPPTLFVHRHSTSPPVLQ